MLVEREATHRAIALSRTGRRADPDRARLRPRGGRADPLGARARPDGLRRDLPAVPVPHRRGPRHRRQLPGRALRLQPAAARQGQPGGDLGRPERRPVHGLLARTTRPSRYDGPEGKKPGGEEVPFRHIPNGIPGLETRLPLLYSEGVLGGRMTLEPLRRAHLHQSGQGLRPAPAQGHDRDRQRRRPGDLGRARVRAEQRAAAPRRRLHALRRHDAAGLARR